MWIKKRRFEALEKAVEALQGQLEVEAAARERKESEKATLSQTLNEWVYGKEEAVDGE